MIVEVKMFAIAQQLTGRETVELNLVENATVADLRAALAEQHPSLAAVQDHLLIAINTEYARDDMKIPAGVQIACIPPVSGG